MPHSTGAPRVPPDAGGGTCRGLGAFPEGRPSGPSARAAPGPLRFPAPHARSVQVLTHIGREGYGKDEKLQKRKATALTVKGILTLEYDPAGVLRETLLVAWKPKR